MTFDLFIIIFVGLFVVGLIASPSNMWDDAGTGGRGFH